MEYRFADCVFDTGRLELQRSGSLLRLEPQVAKVLMLLIDQRSRVVSRDELLDAVWGRKVVSDNALTVRVNSLRRALGDDGLNQQIIRTVPKNGYRFIAAVITKPSAIVEVLEQHQPPPAHAVRRPSLIVLPFLNVGDPRFDIMAEGLTYDITTRIGRT